MFKKLEIVLLMFRHYCHVSATQARLHGLYFAHPLDVVHLQYCQY